MLRLARSIRGNTFAKSAIESALLDALGKRLHLPVSELLGGRVRDALPVAWTLASGNTEQDIAEAEKMLDLRRHRVFKLKIGAGEVSADLAHVIAIKKPGERASVRVDVNQAWDEAVALRACKVLGDNAIDLIEQPISRNNRAGMARLQLSSPAPIMADESIECVEDAFNLAREGAASVFALKIAKNGGRARVAHGRDCRSGRDRPIRRHHARRRPRHPGLGSCVSHPGHTGVGHRAVRPAAAHRRHPHRAAGVPRFPAACQHRTGPGPGHR